MPSEKVQKKSSPNSPPKGRQSTQRRTPKKASTQPVSNTIPQVLRSTTTPIYTSATSALVQRREAVMDHVGHGDEIPFSTLLEAVLPIDNSEALMAVWSRIKSQRKIISNEVWTAFKTPPSQQSGTEEEVFQPLEDVFQAIITAAGKADMQNIQFKVHGSKIPSSGWPNRTRPDGTLHLKKTSLPYERQNGIIDHADICCYMEFKKGNNPSIRRDNACKVIYNAHHRFRCDPRCRHVFGLTIEDTSTRFWFFSRATVAVSKVFDFREKPLVLVQLFLAFACSSVEKLGFDTTIRCVDVTQLEQPSKQREDEGGAGNMDTNPNNAEGSTIVARRTRQAATGGRLNRKNDTLDLASASPEQVLSNRVYEFMVHVNGWMGPDVPQKGRMRTFRTLRCIANYGAVGIRSRGTRVFEVTDVDKPGSIYVLKDVWIDEDRTPEGMTLLDIRGRLKQDNPDALQHFLDVECHGVVTLDGQKDLTSSIPSKSNEKWAQYDFRSEFSEIGQKRGHDGQIKGPFGSWQGGKADAPSPKRIIGRRGDPRQHYRIVFKGKPGTAINHLSIDEAFVALEGGAKAVWAMYKLGYIHRDLSCGNILLVDGSKGPTGVLIDLEYANRFPRNDNAPHDYRMGTREFMANEVDMEIFLQFQSRDETYMPKWFHNPIHDVESIWWIALWTFYYLQEAPSRQKNALFPGSGFGWRTGIWSSPQLYDSLCNRPPDTIQDILYLWLSCIKAEYISLEAGFDMNATYLSFDYNKACEASIKFLKDIQIALQEIRDQEAPYEEAEEVDDRPRKRVKVESIDPLDGIVFDS